ncbi:hypothetical protein V6N11_079420 [Hibiscus sabdariffa]|uniref:Uncharacterized protein n=1 Tax=Hibiscus sabdariffa TaxID=183260 RepID=A0ABR2RVV0_9ROSI
MAPPTIALEDNLAIEAQSPPIHLTPYVPCEQLGNVSFAGNCDILHESMAYDSHLQSDGYSQSDPQSPVIGVAEPPIEQVHELGSSHMLDSVAGSEAGPEQEQEGILEVIDLDAHAVESIMPSDASCEDIEILQHLSRFLLSLF